MIDFVSLESQLRSSFEGFLTLLRKEQFLIVNVAAVDMELLENPVKGR